MALQPMVQERRRHRRIPRSREVALFHFSDPRDHPGYSRGRLADISASGAAVRVQGAQAPPIGSSGTLTIHFEGFRFVTEAQVVRQLGDGYAFEFSEVSTENVDFVGALADDAEE